MISFRLTDGDIGGYWHSMADGYGCGKSRIHPFRHSALEELAIASESRFLVFVRERLAGISQAGTGRITHVDEACFDSLARELRTWPLQWQMLVIGGASRNESVLAVTEAGHWGTAPTFLLADGASLWGDWDAAHLLPRLPHTSLDPALAARYLAEYDTPYARNTMFRGLHLLTERARAVWAGKPGCATLSITYPSAWPRPPVGVLREEADPVAAFETIVSSSMRRWTNVSEAVLGVEVSGGLDSSLVASSAAALCATRLRSYGIGLMGESTEDQRVRRAEVSERFGLVDTEVSIASFLPLAPGSCRLDGRAPLLPWEEGYYEVFDEMATRASAAGTEVLLTGFGGDELSGLRPSELRALRGEPGAPAPPDPPPTFLTPSARATLSDELDLPPRAASSESAVACAALSAARYMRRGIWPIHPLCTPQLVHFCARLPAEWRYRRRLEREALIKRGCSDRVIHPHRQDDFSWALAATLRGPARPLAERLFADAALHELGIVDGGELIRSYKAWCDRGRLEEAVRYFAALVTELCLRSMR